MLTKKDKNYLTQLLNNEKMYYSSELNRLLEVSKYNKDSSIKTSIKENESMLKYINSLELKLSK